MQLKKNRKARVQVRKEGLTKRCYEAALWKTEEVELQPWKATMLVMKIQYYAASL